MRDARALPILAKTIFRELKQNGLTDEDIIHLAGELLAQVTSDLRAQSITLGAPVKQPRAR